MDRISVVVPCYRSAPFLEEALASLRAQTRPPDEVIVADDGSTDEATVALLPRLERDGVRVLREPHRGPGPARNAAIGASSGTLVLPLDADDALAPAALEKLAGALEADASLDFAFSHVEYFGSVRGTAVPPRFNPYLELDDNKLVVTALFRRSVFSDRGLGYPALDGYEDWSFWLSACEAGLCGVAVEEPLFRYRRHDAGRLTADHARRASLMAGLRQRHAALYERRAELKLRFAPGVECIGGARVTLADAVASAPRDARELLFGARGKYLLFGAGVGDALVRELEAEPKRDVARAGDLVLVRTHALTSLAAVPEGAPPEWLIPDAPSLSRRTWKLARGAAERMLGEDRVGQWLHPLKERAATIGPRPLLPPSVRVERALLDREPVHA